MFFNVTMLETTSKKAALVDRVPIASNLTYESARIRARAVAESGKHVEISPVGDDRHYQLWDKDGPFMATSFFSRFQ